MRIVWKAEAKHVRYINSPHLLSTTSEEQETKARKRSIVINYQKGISLRGQTPLSRSFLSAFTRFHFPPQAQNLKYISTSETEAELRGYFHIRSVCTWVFLEVTDKKWKFWSILRVDYLRDISCCLVQTLASQLCGGNTFIPGINFQHFDFYKTCWSGTIINNI